VNPDTPTPRTDQVPPPPRRRRPRRRRHALSVAGATLATFLAAMTLLTAQMRAGHDPALGTGTRVALVAKGNGRAALTTRTSGARANTAPAAKGKHAAKPLRTSSSGGGRHRDHEERDT